MLHQPSLRRLASPGLIAVAALAGHLVAAHVGNVSPLIPAFAAGALLGAALGPTLPVEPIAGLAKRLLRVGVALLGLRLTLQALVEIGPGGIAVAATVVALTLAAGVALSALAGVPRDVGLLISAGTAVCGASAIAAVSAAVRGRDEATVYAVAAVTAVGTVAMLITPPLAVGLLGLDDAEAGGLIGASVHEVAQVFAAGAAVSPAALKLATVVKLTRVALLAPAVMVCARLSRAAPSGDRPPLLPPFVAAFLLLVAAGSSGLLPAAVASTGADLSGVLLTAAMAGIGLTLRFPAIRAYGVRPLLVGIAVWLVAVATSLVTVLAVLG